MSDRDPDGIGLHSLRPKSGSRKPRKRIGRGAGSGTGKTSGRGHKGYGQRSGSKSKLGYEGGQNPIHMRMGKLRGPNNKMSMPFEPFRTTTQPVNVSDLDERFDAGAEVTPETLREAGLATRRDPVKILGNGEISTKLTVRADRFSASAIEKIEAAGGTCETLEGEKAVAGERPPKRKPDSVRKPLEEKTEKEEEAKEPKAEEPGSDEPKAEDPAAEESEADESPAGADESDEPQPDADEGAGDEPAADADAPDSEASEADADTSEEE